MKHYISLSDIDSLDDLLGQVKHHKTKPLHTLEKHKGKSICLLFFNPSLRTRLSTQQAAANLGASCSVLDVAKDSWKLEFSDGTVMDGDKAEHIREAAAVISQYHDVIGIRSFPALTDRDLDYSEFFLNQFIRNATKPVLNLESGSMHPLQGLTDLFTIHDKRKSEKPKVVLTWAPHIRALPQAVPNSMAQFVKEKYDLVIVHPPGYELDTSFTAGAKIMHNQEEAFQGADFIYAKNWSSYSDYGKIIPVADNWMVTNEKMKKTNQAYFMHCLPVRRNVIVEDSVLDSEYSLVIEQAANRLFTAQAVLDKLLSNE